MCGLSTICKANQQHQQGKRKLPTIYGRVNIYGVLIYILLELLAYASRTSAK